MSEQDKEETPIFTDLGRQQEDGHAIHHPDTDHGVEFEDWGDIIDWDRVLTQAGAGILDLPEPEPEPETKVYVLDDHADFPEPVPVNGASDWEMGVSSVSYPEEEK